MTSNQTGRDAENGTQTGRTAEGGAETQTGQTAEDGGTQAQAKPDTQGVERGTKPRTKPSPKYQAEYGKVLDAAELGRLARAHRKQHKLTLQTLSGLGNLSMRFLSEFERGKETAELGKVLQTLRLLGLDVIVQPRRVRRMGVAGSTSARVAADHGRNEDAPEATARGDAPPSPAAATPPITPETSHAPGDSHHD